MLPGAGGRRKGRAALTLFSLQAGEGHELLRGGVRHGAHRPHAEAAQLPHHRRAGTWPPHADQEPDPPLSQSRAPSRTVTKACTTCPLTQRFPVGGLGLHCGGTVRPPPQPSVSLPPPLKCPRQSLKPHTVSPVHMNESHSEIKFVSPVCP